MDEIKTLVFWILRIVIFIIIIAIGIDLSFEIHYLFDVEKSENANNLPEATVGIVLGAAVYGKKPSPILSDRLKGALDLYKKKKVKKILLSGDNGSADYNEIKPMLTFMLKNRVKKEDIFLDYSGFRTYDTLRRARYIFNVKDAVIVTQRFHQPRAAYIAYKLGIKVYSLETDFREYKDTNKNRFREFFARNLAWIDMNLLYDKNFVYKGKNFPITGSGELTWKAKDLIKD